MQGTHRKNIHQCTELRQVGTSGREECVCCQNHNRLLSSFNVALSLNPCLPPVSVRLLLFPSRHRLRLQPHFLLAQLTSPSPPMVSASDPITPIPQPPFPRCPQHDPPAAPPTPTSPHQYLPHAFSCCPLVLSQHCGLGAWCALLLPTKSRGVLGVPPSAAAQPSKGGVGSAMSAVGDDTIIKIGEDL